MYNFCDKYVKLSTFPQCGKNVYCLTNNNVDKMWITLWKTILANYFKKNVVYGIIY